DLLGQWKALRAQGTTLSAEDLCQERPELHDDLRRQIEALLSMEHFQGAAADEVRERVQSEAEAASRATSGASLPEVPGYEVLEELGRGGMGVVYKARHVRLDRLVALKMILAGQLAGPEHRDRFLAEARAVARLQHENIVQIYEIGEQRGLPFFSLEF